MFKILLILLPLSISFAQQTNICDNIVLQNNDSCTGYYVLPHYPNPFGGITQIKFGIPDSSKVSFAVFDKDEVLLKDKSDCILKSGNYYYDFSFMYAEYKPGIYFIKFIAEYTGRYKIMNMEFISTTKIILVK